MKAAKHHRKDLQFKMANQDVNNAQGGTQQTNKRLLLAKVLYYSSYKVKKGLNVDYTIYKCLGGFTEQECFLGQCLFAE